MHTVKRRSAKQRCGKASNKEIYDFTGFFITCRYYCNSDMIHMYKLMIRFALHYALSLIAVSSTAPIIMFSIPLHFTSFLNIFFVFFSCCCFDVNCRCSLIRKCAIKRLTLYSRAYLYVFMSFMRLVCRWFGSNALMNLIVGISLLLNCWLRNKFRLQLANMKNRSGFGDFYQVPIFNFWKFYALEKKVQSVILKKIRKVL